MPFLWVPFTTPSQGRLRSGSCMYCDAAHQVVVQVTFFWNGNVSGYFNEELETYVEIPSDKVRSCRGAMCHARGCTLRLLEQTWGCSHCSADVHDSNPSAMSSAVAARHWRPMSQLRASVLQQRSAGVLDVGGGGA